MCHRIRENKSCSGTSMRGAFWALQKLKRLSVRPIGFRISMMDTYILFLSRRCQGIPRESYSGKFKNNYWIKKGKGTHGYSDGDLVMLGNFDFPLGVSKKIIRKFKGSYKVTKSYDLTGTQQPIQLVTKIHSNPIKAFVSLN